MRVVGPLMVLIGLLMVASSFALKTVQVMPYPKPRIQVISFNKPIEPDISKWQTPNSINIEYRWTRDDAIYTYAQKVLMALPIIDIDFSVVDNVYFTLTMSDNAFDTFWFTTDWQAGYSFDNVPDQSIFHYDTTRWRLFKSDIGWSGGTEIWSIPEISIIDNDYISEIGGLPAQRIQKFGVKPKTFYIDITNCVRSAQLANEKWLILRLQNDRITWNDGLYMPPTNQRQYFTFFNGWFILGYGVYYNLVTGVKIRGVVVDTNNNPISKVLVYCDDNYYLSPDGYFEFDVAPNTTHVLKAERENYEMVGGEVVVSVGKDDIVKNIVMERLEAPIPEEEKEEKAAPTLPLLITGVVLIAAGSSQMVLGKVRE